MCKRVSFILDITLCLVLSGCMPMTYPPGVKGMSAQLGNNTFITEDGARLPLRYWLPQKEARAVIIALHGFNDYSRFFEQPGRYFSKLAIACYAYDQRGFGAAPKRGRWAGIEAYIDDLNSLVKLLEQRYPKRPIYLLGESMGGAIIMTAVSQRGMPQVAGMILVAPALWARETMPWYQTGLLWTLAHSVPWLTLTGESVHVTPSDNIEMLRALGRDPWVIKGARVETLYGLANLMDAAFNSADSLRGNTLLLYGEKDEIIPKKPTFAFLKRFLTTHPDEKTVAFYQQGYHMLLRDLQGSTIWHDIAAWIDSGPESLPSGADERAKLLMSQFISSETGLGGEHP